MTEAVEEAGEQGSSVQGRDVEQEADALTIGDDKGTGIVVVDGVWTVVDVWTGEALRGDGRSSTNTAMTAAATESVPIRIVPRPRPRLATIVVVLLSAPAQLPAVLLGAEVEVLRQERRPRS